MLNGGYITLIALTLQNALAFTLALACDREMRLKRFYRLVFFIPPVLSEIVVGMIWRLIIDDISGANLINRMLAGMGLSGLAHHWLYDEKTALTAVALVHSWKGFGWGFLILLAGLQTIPREIYEAARVDGASAWDSFRKITLPLMIPVSITVAILTVLGTMQSFALIIGLVGGELGGYTSVPVLRILNSMVGASRFGYACAQGISFGLVLVIISFIQYKFSSKFRNV
jgi:ABC-type sugar transport system permease subunit